MPRHSPRFATDLRSRIAAQNPERSVLNPSESFELVSPGVELLNLRLHALPSVAAHVPHHRRVLLLDHLPSAHIVDNEEAAHMSIIDEIAIEEHRRVLLQQEAPQLDRRRFFKNTGNLASLAGAHVATYRRFSDGMATNAHYAFRRDRLADLDLDRVTSREELACKLLIPPAQPIRDEDEPASGGRDETGESEDSQGNPEEPEEGRQEARAGNRCRLGGRHCLNAGDARVH